MSPPFNRLRCALQIGLVVATLLTLVFLPALYVAWFRVRPAEAEAQPPKQHHVPQLSSPKTACDVV